jgi:hypothetical protein
MACMLWENTFYESGVDIADRIAQLIPKVDSEAVRDMAIEARTDMKLRHAPLLVARELAREKENAPLIRDLLKKIIQRPDEMTEFLAIYNKDGKQPLSGQLKKGLADAFPKFDAYQLAKYNRDGEYKLRDVMFLSHPKPKDKEQEATWKKLVDGTLEPPDTWEVALSSGADKKEAWTRLLSEQKLGGMALLRNLRNMHQAGVDENLVFYALENMKVGRILPFRFIAAAQQVPQWENEIEPPMMKAMEGIEALPGRTVLLIDRSASMGSYLSGRSKMRRYEAACGLAIMAREMMERGVIYTFADITHLVPNRRGFALVDAMGKPYNGTMLGAAVAEININVEYDRLIVITDEQSHDRVPDPKGRGYMVNVGVYENGVGYGKWTHIDGWRESILRFIY